MNEYSATNAPYRSGWSRSLGMPFDGVRGTILDSVLIQVARRDSRMMIRSMSTEMDDTSTGRLAQYSKRINWWIGYIMTHRGFRPDGAKEYIATKMQHMTCLST